MEGYYSTGQSPQWAVVPMEEEEDIYIYIYIYVCVCVCVYIHVKLPLSTYTILVNGTIEIRVYV